MAPKGGCPPNWKKFNAKCYSIINDQKLTWDGGRKQCRAMGGNLASIPTRHVQVFLMSQMAATPISDLWIGLRTVDGGEFYWTDGRPRQYLNFLITGRRYIYPWIHHRIWQHIHRISRQEAIDFQRYLMLRAQPKNNCVVISTQSSLATGKWINKSCNDTNGFVCLRNVDTSFPDSSEPTTSIDYVNIWNDSMKAVTQQMTWDAAKKHCEDDGANLPSLRNEWSHAYIELLTLNLKSPIWIGLNKVQTNGYFRFIDGWHLSFSHWGENEPSGDRPCVYVDVDGKWKTALCNQTMNSVCMKSTDVPPTGSSFFPGVCPDDPDPLGRGQNYVWLPYKGYCYIFFTEEKGWADASSSCVRHGGLLASIEDPSEQDFIQSNARIFQDSHKSFWIGLYKTHKGEWLWLDKTVMDYTNWVEGPTNQHSHGEISTSNGTWKATYGGYYRPYICKTPKVLPPTPSLPPPAVLDLRHHGYTALAVVLVITGIAMGAVVAFFLFVKSGQRIPILDNLLTFDNPLFFSNERFQSDVADTDKLVANAEEENPEPLVKM